MTMTDTHAVVDSLTKRNADFAATSDVAELTMLPAGRTIVIGCVDPRVDPAHVLGVELGEAAVIRNIGGRVTPTTLRTLALLGALTRAAGLQPCVGWNLVVLHHTDCGITQLLDFPDALAADLGVDVKDLDPETISDPRLSLAADLAALHANPVLPPALIVSGLLYDTATARIETIVAPAALGSAADRG